MGRRTRRSHGPLRKHDKRKASELTRAELRYRSRNSWLHQRVNRYGKGPRVKRQEEAAPQRFSFINNVEESVAFVARVRRTRLTKPVFADFAGVTEVTIEALLALVADPADLKGISGNLPRDPAASQVMVCSGLSALVQGLPRPPIQQGAIYKSADGVNVANQAASRAARFVAGFLGVDRHKPSRSILVECMANTNNHAADHRGQKQWKLWVSHDVARGVVACAFVDFGKGICRSLAKNWAAQMGAVNDGDLLAAAIRGVTSSTFQDFVNRLTGRTVVGLADHSSTGLHNRGHGLPNMLENVGFGGIRRLVVIANRGYVEVTAPDRQVISRTLSSEFLGTLVCWEVTIGEAGEPA